ncbi:MAG: hypothetical protein KF862_13030 [Chitinophagaceae bacterium]|nr:hypothetical protein [Chitinophagaceae bacterium]
MSSTITKTTVETLLKTWMICEATVHLQDCLRQNNKEIYHQFKACAGSCFNMARELMEPTQTFTLEHHIACMVECRTCAKICRQFADIPEIAFCGSICESCLASLVTINMNYQLN